MSNTTDLQIAATERTPEIQLSLSTGLFSMKGESYPEDVAAVYGQVVQAVEQLPGALTRMTMTSCKSWVKILKTDSLS